MDPFFIYVSIGALVLLILILIFVGVSLTKLQSTDLFPPTQSACPDYWDISSNPLYCGVPILSSMRNRGGIANTSDGKQIDTTAPQNIGMCVANSSFGCVQSGVTPYLKPGSSGANFQYVQLNNNPSWQTMYPGVSERCAKKSWANTMDIYWDGVSNYNGC
jgi:hypothetical protein